MSEEPINPFYIYDNADKKYLEENLKRTTDEWRRYTKWAEKVAEEIHYISRRLRQKDGKI